MEFFAYPTSVINEGSNRNKGVGAVTSKVVFPYAWVVEKPCKQLGWISEFGHRLSFSKEILALRPEGNE